MKKLVAIVSIAVLLGACAEKKVITPEEKWNGYCTSISYAAQTIASDRQNGISKEEALAYANKVTDTTTNTLLVTQIEKIYAYPADLLKIDKDAVQAQFKEAAKNACLNTPHDPNKMPVYKPF